MYTFELFDFWDLTYICKVPMSCMKIASHLIRKIILLPVLREEHR